MFISNNFARPAFTPLFNPMPVVQDHCYPGESRLPSPWGGYRGPAPYFMRGGDQCHRHHRHHHHHHRGQECRNLDGAQQGGLGALKAYDQTISMLKKMGFHQEQNTLKGIAGTRLGIIDSNNPWRKDADGSTYWKRDDGKTVKVTPEGSVVNA